MAANNKAAVDATTKQQILSAWRAPGGASQYAGAQSLYQQLLKSGRRDISLAHVKQALQTSPVYQGTINTPRRAYATRHIQYGPVVPGVTNVVSGSRHYFEADLAFMNRDSKGRSVILVLIDQFSRKCYTRALNNKTSAAVENALTDIFEKEHISPSVLSTDEGNEFIPLRNRFLKPLNCNLIIRKGRHKSFICERAIRTLKLRLWRFIYDHGRGTAWSDGLPLITEAINNTPTATFAHMFSPNQIDDPANDPAVRNLHQSLAHARDAEHKEYQRKEPTDRNINEGDLVMADALPGTFEKSATLRRGHLYVIDDVRRIPSDQSEPTLFILRPWHPDPKPEGTLEGRLRRRYYAFELRKAAADPRRDPNTSILDVLVINKRMGTVQGGAFYKFLFYGYDDPILVSADEVRAFEARAQEQGLRPKNLDETEEGIDEARVSTNEIISPSASLPKPPSPRLTRAQAAKQRALEFEQKQQQYRATVT